MAKCHLSHWININAIFFGLICISLPDILEETKVISRKEEVG